MVSNLIFISFFIVIIAICWSERCKWLDACNNRRSQRMCVCGMIWLFAQPDQKIKPFTNVYAVITRISYRININVDSNSFNQCRWTIECVWSRERKKTCSLGERCAPWAVIADGIINKVREGQTCSKTNRNSHSSTVYTFTIIQPMIYSAWYVIKLNGDTGAVSFSVKMGLVLCWIVLFLYI